MLKKPHIVAAGAVSLLVILLLSLPTGFTHQVKRTISGLLMPFFGLSSAADKTAKKAGELIVPRSVLTEENRKLKEEVQQLKFQLSHTDTIRNENDKLRQMIGFAQRVPWKLKPARIIARDPANWWRTAEINVGKRDGVFVNAPVITTHGLVGKVVSSKTGRSQILLLGDANCQAAAIVQDTGEHGIVKAYSADPSIVTLTYLSKGNNAQEGQTVVTSDFDLRPGHAVASSGLGGVFPAGIPIGKIIDIRNVGYGLYLEARVRLTVNFSKLDKVYVVVP